MSKHYANFFLGLALPLLTLLPSALLAETQGIDPAITRLLQARLGDVAVNQPVATPVNELYQTRFGSKYAYLSSDGRYVLVGDMIDLKTGVNLTDKVRQEVARETLAAFPIGDLVVFPAEGKTRTFLNVFTDSSCPYCKKLHQEVPELQKAGIEVRYFPFPRGGARGPGYQELRQVWCSKDRRQAMNIVKDVDSGDLGTADCANAQIVDRAYNLGNEVGVSGTPALFTQSGRKLDGYVPHQQLIPLLLSDS
jgi:thiol:disulfide interchange protein DsbC